MFNTMVNLVISLNQDIILVSVFIECWKQIVPGYKTLPDIDAYHQTRFSILA